MWKGIASRGRLVTFIRGPLVDRAVLARMEGKCTLALPSQGTPALPWPLSGCCFCISSMRPIPIEARKNINVFISYSDVLAMYYTGFLDILAS